MRRPAVLVSTLAFIIAALVAVPVQPSFSADPLGGRLVDLGADDAGASPAAKAGPRIIAPGRIGKARVGMTVAQAVATGQFNQDVENPPCDTITLQPKKPFKNQYVVFVADDRIVEMDAGGSRISTSNGIRVDSTYRRVKRAYGGALSKPSEVGFGQWGAFVSTGKKGPERRWIGFLFGNAFVDDAPLSGKDTVTLMGVTKGSRPPLILDGC